MPFAILSLFAVLQSSVLVEPNSSFEPVRLGAEVVGTRLLRVPEGSPLAVSGGLQVGDVVRHVDGHFLDEFIFVDDLLEQVEPIAPGFTVPTVHDVEFTRDGVTRHAKMTFLTPQGYVLAEGLRLFRDTYFVPVPFEGGAEGVRIFAQEGFADSGLENYDVLIRIGGHPVNEPGELVAAISSARGARLAVEVRRGDALLTFHARLDE